MLRTLPDSSRSPLARFLHARTTRLAVLVLGTVLAAATIVKSLQTLRSPLLEQKDLLQDYLLGRALLAGIPPYLPVQELAQALAIETADGAALFPHPCPHPPTMLPVALVLAGTSFDKAAAGWLVLSIIALIGGILIVDRCSRRTGSADSEESRWRTLTPDWIAIAALASWPVSYDLFFGQFGCFLLFLLALAFRSERKGNYFASGIAIGGALCLKLYGWPLLIRAALLRRYRVIAGAAFILGIADLLAVALAGPAEVLWYYTDVAPYSGSHYAASERNISLWTVGQRLFLGLHPGVTRNVVEAPPLFESPFLATAVNIALPVLLLCYACVALRGVLGTPRAFAAFLILGSVSNPVAWESYLVPLVLALMLLFPLVMTVLGIGWRLVFGSTTFVLLFAPALRDLIIGSQTEVGTIRGLLTAVPLLCVLALFALAVAAARAAGATGREHDEMSGVLKG